MDFCTQILFQPPKLKKKIYLNFDFEGSKNFWGKKSKLPSHRFFKILAVSVLANFEVHISKTVGGDSYPVNLFYQQKLAILQTSNSANFQNIFN